MTSYNAIGRPIVIPEEGVFTEDGFLFHHVGTAHLKPDMIQRLLEHGIYYLQGARFKPEEDAIIRRNWLQYGEEFDIPVRDAVLYAGAHSKDGTEDPNIVARRRHFCLETNFWPRMCKDLPLRSGKQVRRRLLYLFDPAVLEQDESANITNSLNYTEFMNFILEYKRCSNVRIAAEAIKKRYATCASAYSNYMAKQGKMKKSERKRLYNTVAHNLISSKPNFINKVRKAIKRNDKEKLAFLTGLIDFNKLQKALLRPRESVVESWNEILDELVAEYEKSFKTKQNSTAAWTAACNVVFKSSRLSPDIFCLFMHLLPEFIDDEACYMMFRKNYVHIGNLKDKLLEFGITGFIANNDSEEELDYLLRRAQKLLYRCEKLIFSKLIHNFTVKERIQIISLALDKQYGDSDFEKKGNDNMASNETKPDEVPRLYLKTVSFIESLIPFVQKLDPDWIPPSAFRKYVKSKEILRLFPKNKDNSALISKKQQKLLLQDYTESFPEIPVNGKRNRTPSNMED